MCNVNSFVFGLKNLSRKEIEGKRVLEVGAYDVNGSLRHVIQLLDPGEYLGVDIVPGPGVDLICPAEEMVERFGADSFDLVISTCMLEHVKNWREALSNIKNVCKPNGLLLIIMPSHAPYHAHPHDYWRYSQEDFKNIFADCEILRLEEDEKRPSLVYAKIRKPANYVEKDLSEYNLYSIILDKKAPDVSEDDYQKFVKRFLIKKKIKETIRKIGGRIFNRIMG